MKAKKRFGQHFLLPEWADKVVAAIDPQPSDRFLEIGPGAGVLTTRLAARAWHVTAIEVDRDLAADLRRSAPPNIDVVTADIRRVDLSAYLADGPLRIAGNLPYNISSPILFRLLASKRGQVPFPGITNSEKRGQVQLAKRDLSPFAGDALTKRDVSPFADATVMLQREVVYRLVAKPGTGDYGVLTIFVNAAADVHRLLTLPPGAFRPAPKVHSAVVRLTFVPSRIPADLDPVFSPMVRSMFTQRRKTLLNALRPFAATIGADARAALTRADIDPTARPETLDLDRLLALAQSLKPKA